MIERQSTKLRQLLRAKTFLHMPSVYNVIGARLVQSLGFEAVYIGGYVTGGSTAITEPLLTMNEQIEPARNIAQNVNIPLLADAGSGWGEPIHTMRTMREFIRGGIAGVSTGLTDLDRRLGGLQLLIDDGETAVPEARIGEVAVHDASEFLGAHRTTGAKQFEILRNERITDLLVPLVHRERQQLAVGVGVHVAGGVDEMGDVTPPGAVALGDLHGIAEHGLLRVTPDAIEVVDRQFTVIATVAVDADRKSTRLNSSHVALSRMPSSA